MTTMHAPQSPLETVEELNRLALQLQATALEITTYHRVLQFSGKTSHGQDPWALVPVGAPASIKAAQTSIAEAAIKLQKLVMSPSTFLNQQAVQCQQLACLRWLCHFKIVSHVPVDASIAYTQLAKLAGVPLAQLKSTARMAMIMGFMAEPQPEQLSHSPLSAAFARDSSLVEWALFIANGTAPSASKLVEATERFGVTEKKTETAYNISKQTDLPFFDWIKTDAGLTAQFAGYMKNIANADATSFKHVVAGFDWASLGQAKVVDVGGSSGHAAIALATAFPSLDVTVQDLPDTIETSKTDLSTLDPTVARRIAFQHHDFFTAQPVHDADVFFLRTIIHDWPAAEARAILAQLAKVLRPGARILIMDIVLPRPGSVGVGAGEEALARLRDLTMIETFNAKERELWDWEELARGVEPKLRVASVGRPEGSSLSVLELVVDGEAGAGAVGNGTVVGGAAVNGATGGGAAVNVVEHGEANGVHSVEAVETNGTVSGNGTA